MCVLRTVEDAGPYNFVNILMRTLLTVGIYFIDILFWFAERAAVMLVLRNGTCRSVRLGSILL